MTRWMMVRVNGEAAEMLASHTHLLYQLWTLVKDEWAGLDVAALREGKIVVPTFPALAAGVRHLPDANCTHRARFQQRRALQDPRTLGFELRGSKRPRLPRAVRDRSAWANCSIASTRIARPLTSLLRAG